MDNNETDQEELVYNGVCPVCGDKFIDGFDDLMENESYNGRFCVVEIEQESQDGKMLVHIEDENL